MAKVGRPSSFKPEFVEQAHSLALLGATDADLADFFDVTPQTINNWKKDFQEFFDALKAGKSLADAKVAKSLFQRAVGYDIGDKHYPSDTTAAIFWLKNRRRQDWRDVHQVEGQGLGAQFLGINIVLRDGDTAKPTIEVSSTEAAAPPKLPSGRNGRTKP